MNELQIFNHPMMKEQPESKQLEILGAAAYMLSMALECERFSDSWELLNLVSKFFHLLDCPAFNKLYGAVVCEVTRRKKDK